MPIYTVKDTQTGKTIKFQWSGEQPPTDADMEQVFSQARTLGGEKTAGRRVLNAIDNLPGSLYEVGKQTASALVNPVQTLSDMGGLAAGGIDSAVSAVLPDSVSNALFPPGAAVSQNKEAFQKGVAEPVSRIARESVQDPWGIPGRMADYAEENPAQFLMNLSLSLGAAGKTAEAAKLANTAKLLQKGSEYTNPLSLVGKPVAPLEERARAWAGRKAPEFYESALKIPPSVPNDIRNKAVATGIENRYMPSQFGLNRLKADITGLNEQIADIIKAGAKKGKTIDMNAVVDRIDTVKDFYKDYPRARKYLDELDSIKADILKEEGLTIPIDKAQRMKQRIYAVHRKHYGELKGLEVEADKAVARGLKEEIVTQHPELAALNAKDSALINLEEVLERAVNRTRNYDTIRLGDTIMTTTGAVLGGEGGAVSAFLVKRVMEDPRVKAKISFALDKAGKKKAYARRVADRPGTTNLLYQSGGFTGGW